MTPRRRQSLLLTHVPKTGGTTLDSVISGHYAADESCRMVQHSSSNDEYVAAVQDTSRYVSGHIPYSGVANLEFDRRITILREPLHVLASIIAFAEETGYFTDELRLAQTQNDGTYNIYSVYFSPAFDFHRYLIDRRYGIAPGYQSYVRAALVGPAIDALRKFDYVLDFRSLDLQIVDFHAKLTHHFHRILTHPDS